MPAVVQTVVGTIKPDRFEDFVAQGLEVTKLFERLGAKEVRLLTSSFAGAQSGKFSFVAEHESGEAFGEFSDQLQADSEFLSLAMRLRSDSNPVTIDEMSLASEIDLGRKMKKTRGAIIEVFASKPHPGRLEDALDLARKACDFAEKQGATRARVWQIVHGGESSGMHYVAWEHANGRAYGKLADAWATDSKGLAIAAAAAGADAPMTIVFSGLYNEIPL